MEREILTAGSETTPAIGLRNAESLIQVEGLRKRYPGGVEALKGVSFDVQRGDRACLLGPNGAGKTTVIRLLTGVLSPDAGSARLMGANAGSPAFLVAKRSVGIVPEAPGMYQELRVGEYLAFVRDLYGHGSVPDVVDAFELGPYMDRPMTTLSGGYQRRAVLAAALLPEPDVLILDEPTARLDPLAAAQIRHYIRRIAEGRTVLLCTHNLAEAEELCDRAIILRAGTVLVDDTLESLRARFARHLDLEAVEDAERVAALVQAAGYRARIDGHLVRVEVSAYKDEVPRLLSALLSSGIRVYGAQVQEPSLEEIFLRMFGEE
jgi:ABC-2 type transport system ATP-binding protein